MARGTVEDAVNQLVQISDLVLVFAARRRKDNLPYIKKKAEPTSKVG